MASIITTNVLYSNKHSKWSLRWKLTLPEKENKQWEPGSSPTGEGKITYTHTA